MNENLESLLSALLCIGLPVLLISGVTIGVVGRYRFLKVVAQRRSQGYYEDVTIAGRIRLWAIIQLIFAAILMLVIAGSCVVGILRPSLFSSPTFWIAAILLVALAISLGQGFIGAFMVRK